MSVRIQDSLLMNYIIAVLLREDGYIAGIPRRFLYGRSTGHKIPVLAIERSNSPFNFHNVVIPFYLAGEKGNQLAELYKLRGILSDLEQTIPKEVEILPELLKESAGEYFHRIYGNSNYDFEKLSVNYRGIVFATCELEKPVLEYVNSNGIFVVYMPKMMAGKDIAEWLSLIKLELKGALKDNLLTIQALKRHTRKKDAYYRLLKKTRKKNTFLTPEELHDLLTIIYAILRNEKLRPLLKYLRKQTIVSLNNYPVIAEIHNISMRKLIEGCASIFLETAQKQRGKNKILAKKIGLLGEIRDLTEKYLYKVSCYIDGNYSECPDILKDLKLNMYLDNKKLNMIEDSKGCLRLKVKEGLSLICDVYLLN